MGFKDANWAYEIELPLAEGDPACTKAVLVALCHATDDKTHQTIVGQERIARMIGASSRSVLRSVGVLVRLGVISQEARRNGGYKTSNRTTINTSYTPESQVTGGQVTESQVTASPISGDTQTDLTCLGVTAEEINQLSQPEGQPEVAAQRGTRIPNDFTVTPAMVAWAREHTPLVDGPRSTEKFIDHWTAATGRNATKRDWVATWRNWLRTDQERAEKAPGRKQTPEERMRATLALVPDDSPKEISS